MKMLHGWKSVIRGAARSLPRRHGFTLTELLVVAVTAAGLIGFTLAAMSSAREDEERAKCADNLRKINTALQMYVNDTGAAPRFWDGDNVWYGRQLFGREYLKADGMTPGNLLDCPSTEEGHTESVHRPHMNYGYSETIVRLTTEQLAGHADMIVTFADCRRYHFSSYRGTDDNLYNAYWGYEGPAGGINWTHEGGANLVFWDGHVKWATREETDRDWFRSPR